MIPPEPDVGTHVRVTIHLPSENAHMDGCLGTVVEHPAASYLLVPVRVTGEEVTRFFHPRNLTEQKD